VEQMSPAAEIRHLWGVDRHALRQIVNVKGG
jgi:hypothetical protein